MKRGRNNNMTDEVAEVKILAAAKVYESWVAIACKQAPNFAAGHQLEYCTLRRQCWTSRETSICIYILR